MSIVPVAIVAGVAYHLARQGVATRTVWLGLNVLDSARALKSTRINGRAVGVQTRRRAMRQALLSWTVYVAIQQVGTVPDRILSWLPLYSVVRAVIVTAFLLARVSMSESIYTTIIQPAVKRYESHIDLTLLLLHSLGTLLYHFTIQHPLEQACKYLGPIVAWIRRLVGLDHLPVLEELSTEITFGSIDDDAPSISIPDLPRIDLLAPKDGAVQDKVARLDIANQRSVPGSSLVETILPKREVTDISKTRRQPDASPVRRSRPLVSSRLEPRPAVPRDVRVKRSSAPTPETVVSSTRPDVFDDDINVLNTAPAIKRKTPASPVSVTRLPTRFAERQERAKTTTKPATNPLQQPPRRAPVARDANVLPPVKPLLKSKSTVELGPTKPSILASQPARPIKSAPARRDPSHAAAAITTDVAHAARRIPSAADRARVMRDAKRKEEAVEIGEKRKPVHPIGPVGSKRSRVHVAKD